MIKAQTISGESFYTFVEPEPLALRSVGERTPGYYRLSVKEPLTPAELRMIRNDLRRHKRVEGLHWCEYPMINAKNAQIELEGLLRAISGKYLYVQKAKVLINASKRLHNGVKKLNHREPMYPYIFAPGADICSGKTPQGELYELNPSFLNKGTRIISFIERGNDADN